jgi:hypothetical protein
MNLESFTVEKVMIHDVPRPSHGPVILTDAPVPRLDADLRNYFRSKVADSLTARGLDVVSDADGHAAVRDAVVAVTDSDNHLVGQSQGLAEHLYGIQTNVNSPGLLAVVTGLVDGGRCVALLKLEREQGLRFRIDVQESGQTVIDVELLRDLTLTDRTRVFKTAILIPGKSGVEGKASDDQRGRKEGEGVADFFLFRFLGCKLAVNPETATRDFYRAAVEFINARVVNHERKTRYQVALIAKLQDNTLHVNPREFAASSIDSTDRPHFIEQLRAAGVDPAVTFEKDTSLADVRGFKFRYHSGMLLLGTAADLEQRVEVSPNGDNTKIKDTIDRVMGR